MEENMDVKISQYLSGEMTGHEREAFEQEIALDQELRTRVEGDGRIWSLASSGDVGVWDVDAAWRRFAKTNKTDVVPASKPVSRLIYWALAASVLLTFGIYGLFFRDGSPVTYAYQEGVFEPVQLKDGSKIYLNKDASVTVFPFSGSKRQVELKGEAFFEIAHNPSKPFYVNCGETVTEVLGTSFNIRQSADQTLILVSSGKVIFSPTDEAQKSAALRAGEAAIYQSGKVQLIANPSPNINAWRTHDLRFVKMPLSAVIEDIAIYFDQDIIIENEDSKACFINIPLAKKPEINSILRAVAECINAEFVQDGTKYIIRGGKVCP